MAMRPIHTNDCDHCTYMATTIGHFNLDWYVCHRGPGQTVFARHGDLGWEYSSYPAFLLDEPKYDLAQSGTVHGQLESHIIAREMLRRYREA